MAHEAKPTTERLLDLSKSIDKVMILGGAAVSFVNPLIGGVIIGGSLATIEGAKRIETGLKSRHTRTLGATAIRHS